MAISFGSGVGIGVGIYIDSDIADFVQEEEPTAESEGDTWYKPSSDILLVWQE